MDFDVVIVGAGAAGLTAAAELHGKHRRVLVLDRESFGGQVMNLEWIEDWPGPGERIEGPALGNRLVEAAQGVRMGLGEVVEIERYSGCISVTCADGKAFTASAVVLASGVRPKELGIPGEDRLQGRGMIHCAFCDAGLYSNQPVAVVGGGDAGLIEALYLAKFASKVAVIEKSPQLTASAALQEKARANAKLDIRLGETAAEVLGEHTVSGLRLASGGSLAVQGVLVHAGFEPASEALEALTPLDEHGFVVAGEAPEGVFVAGDLRSGSPRRAAAAIEDGKEAAERAERFLAAL